MIVAYRTNKLKKQCEDPGIAKRVYGDRIGAKLTQRIEELIAATSLLDIKYIPSTRLHRLEGTMKEQYAVDLVHPHRLVFKPLLKEDEDITNLESIIIVRIEEVTDYHGKQK